MTNNGRIKVGDTVSVLYTTPKGSKERQQEEPVQYRITDRREEFGSRAGGIVVVSETSPVGTALLGESAGSTVTFKLPGGHRRAKILKNLGQNT